MTMGVAGDGATSCTVLGGVDMPRTNRLYHILQSAPWSTVELVRRRAMDS